MASKTQRTLEGVPVIDTKLYSHQGNSVFDDVEVEPGLLPLSFAWFKGQVCGQGNGAGDVM